MRALKIWEKKWRLREPFVVSRRTYTTSNVVVVEIKNGGCVGRGESAGLDYHGETPQSMAQQIEQVRREMEAGVDRYRLTGLLPAGGARTAVDVALWDLEARQSSQRVWKLAGFTSPHPIVTALDAVQAVRPSAALWG